VLDDVVSSAWNAVGEIAVRSDTSRGVAAVTFAAYDGVAWRVVREGMRGIAFDSVRSVRMTQSGRLAYIGRDIDGDAVVIDDTVIARHPRVVSLALARDGHAAWIARNDARTTTLIRDGDTIATGNVLDFALVEGERIVWVESDGDRQKIVTNQGAFSFDFVVAGTLQFVGNGESWVALAGDRARRSLFIVVDGRATTTRFDWWEVTRRIQQYEGDAGIRSWVAGAALREMALSRK
jgi:hypothetical protein